MLLVLTRVYMLVFYFVINNLSKILGRDNLVGLKIVGW
jgi:hypothetical protein